jgi:hypothetical protein
MPFCILPGRLHLTDRYAPAAPERSPCRGKRTLRNSGYQEITSLLAFHQAMFRALAGALRRSAGIREPRSVGLSLAVFARRITFPWTSCRRVQRVRKSGLTFAPEAGYHSASSGRHNKKT